MGKTKKDGGLLKGNKLPEHGPKSEGVDPLTVGKTTYGEDVKSASNDSRAERGFAGTQKPAEKSKKK